MGDFRSLLCISEEKMKVSSAHKTTSKIKSAVVLVYGHLLSVKVLVARAIHSEER